MIDQEKQALKINTLEVMMEQNNKDHITIMDKIDDIIEKLDNFENKFAGKWTEKVLIWAGATAGIVFIGLIIRWLLFLELK